MKFVTKNILINILISIFVLFLGEYSIYLLLKKQISEEASQHLKMERRLMIKGLKNGIDINCYRNNLGDAVDIHEVSGIQYQSPVIIDLESHEEEEEMEEGQHYEEERFASKKIIFDIENKKKFYRVSILKNIDEDEGITTEMPLIMMISGLIMSLLLVLINVLIYNKMFFPVRKLISDIEKFSITDQKAIAPVKTSTYEFSILSSKISKMSQKILNDYKSMKEFTENMGHEVQTPLAVISSKIEHSMNDENLSSEQAKRLGDALKAVNKLYNLNRGLVLLSRLENRQYSQNEKVNIVELVHQRTGYFSDFIENKNLDLSENYPNQIVVDIDPSLCEILIDNILKNAIRHNIHNGKILISTKAQTLIISNTGEVPKGSTDDFFNRFYTQKTNESLGLGLSIVKKICEYYNFDIHYHYENGFHTVTLFFK